MKDKYCIAYSRTTYYETEWFAANSRKEAIQRVKDIIGDCRIENLIVKEEDNAKTKNSRCNRTRNRGI